MQQCPDLRAMYSVIGNEETRTSCSKRNQIGSVCTISCDGESQLFGPEGFNGESIRQDSKSLYFEKKQIQKQLIMSDEIGRIFRLSIVKSQKSGKGVMWWRTRDSLGHASLWSDSQLNQRVSQIFPLSLDFNSHAVGVRYCLRCRYGRCAAILDLFSLFFFQIDFCALDTNKICCF